MKSCKVENSVKLKRSVECWIHAFQISWIMSSTIFTCVNKHVCKRRPQSVSDAGKPPMMETHERFYRLSSFWWSLWKLLLFWQLPTQLETKKQKTHFIVIYNHKKKCVLRGRRILTCGFKDLHWITLRFISVDSRQRNFIFSQRLEARDDKRVGVIVDEDLQTNRATDSFFCCFFWIMWSLEEHFIHFHSFSQHLKHTFFRF